MSLYSLVYVSAARAPFDAADLAALLAEARTNNRRDDLTGLLLYGEGNFIQALEGPQAALEATFGRIRSDPRHGGVITLTHGPIDRRAFANWAMGWAQAPASPGAWGAFSLTRDALAERLAGAEGAEAAALLDAFCRALPRWGALAPAARAAAGRSAG